MHLGHNDEAKKEMRSLFNQNLFGTPKPKRLLQRIPHIATHENDLVLDSYLGSGTTAAVAHKMRRRRIGIEMGEQGGISKAVASGGWEKRRAISRWRLSLHAAGGGGV